MGKKIAGWLLSAVVVLLLYLFLWPVPIDPQRWEPKPAPALAGDYAVNSVLEGLELYATPNSHGPEDVAVDAEGRVYVGVEEGLILRYQADGSDPQVFANTQGRPLGLDFDNDGNLIVADAVKGLLSVDPNGAVRVLCTEAGYHPFRLTDDVDVDSQNVAWFSDASFKFPHKGINYEEVLESAPNGRLVKYDINTGECEVVLDDLYFANGVAVSADDSYLLVSETMRYRVKRVFIRGPREGEVEVLIDNLPGFPDGISAGSDGIFWMTLAAPRNAIVDYAGPRPWLRKLVYRIPPALRPKAERHPFVLGLDADGKIVHNLQDARGARFSKTTSAQQHNDWLYVGSLTEPNWGRIQMSSLP